MVSIPNLTSAIAFRIYFMAASVLMTVVLSRLLGLEQFGRYSWLMSIAFLLSGLAQAGGNSLVIRETARSYGRGVPVFIVTRVGSISLAVLMLLMIASLTLIEQSLQPTLILLLLLLAGSNLALVLLGASTRGLGLIQGGQWPELVLRPTLFLVILALVVLSGRRTSEEEIIVIQIASFSLSLMIAIWVLIRAFAARPECPEDSIPRGWLGSFFRLGIVGWLAVGNAQLLIILTGYLSSFNESGLYRVASQAVLVSTIGLAALDAVQAPYFATAYRARSFEEIHHLLQQSCRVGLLISSIILGLLLIFGRPVLASLLGQEFSEAYPAVCILSAAHMINATTGNVGTLMIAARLERVLIAGNALALIVTLIAALVFIPLYGATAAALAAASGLLMRNVIAAWFCWRELEILALPFAPYFARSVDREVLCPESR